MSDTTTISPVFEGNIVLKGKIECLTGLHIGGSKEKLEIGGVDSPVLRNPQTKYPYIPGSSLKGKMRHLLEYSLGVVSEGNKLGDVSKNVNIVRLFGIGADDRKGDIENVGPTRLIVRDCHPDEVTISMWREMDSELLYTEYKPENTIDRITSAANPRFIERVVAGSTFDFELIYGIYKMSENDTDMIIQKDLDNLIKALRLLESNTLGKSGSRGYGQIKFHVKSPYFLKTEDYEKGGQNYEEASSKVMEKLEELKELSAIQLKYIQY